MNQRTSKLIDKQETDFQLSILESLTIDQQTRTWILLSV